MIKNKLLILLKFLEIKIGDKAKVDPKFTGLDSWIEGTVIDIEKNPFKGIVIYNTQGSLAF